MAVIADYMIAEGPAKGARIIIDDACYRGISAEELARRRQEVARVIRDIDFNRQMRQMEERDHEEEQKPEMGQGGDVGVGAVPAGGDHDQLRPEGGV